MRFLVGCLFLAIILLVGGVIVISAMPLAPTQQMSRQVVPDELLPR